MTMDEHEDCDTQLCEAEDKIIELNEQIKGLEADAKIKQSVCKTIEKEVTEINEKLKQRIKELEDTFKDVCTLINREGMVSKWRILNRLEQALKHGS